MKTNCGAYEIKNILDGKVYIGSSVNLKSRKWYHFNDLKLDKHKNKHLQNAYNKIKKEYGEENVKNYFKWKILEEIEISKDKLIKLEQGYLNNYIRNKKVNRKKCYNIRHIAENNLGIKRSEETKEKLRKISTGRKQSQETIEKRVSKFRGKPSPLKGIKRSKESIEKSIVTRKNNNIRQSEKVKKILKEANSTPVKNLDTSKVFDNIKEAMKFYDIKGNNISSVCKGKRKTCGGYRWSYYKGD